MIVLNLRKGRMIDIEDLTPSDKIIRNDGDGDKVLFSQF